MTCKILKKMIYYPKEKGSVFLDIKSIIEKSNLNINKEQIKYNEPMKNHTTFKIGGPADCYIIIKTREELKEVLVFAKKEEVPVTIVGNGSNLLVLDNGIEGIVLNIRIDDIKFKEDNENIEIKVGAGYKLSILGQKCLQNEITGFEELSGIPGTIGGAIIMNAGAHGKEMKDIVKSIKAFDYNGNEHVFLNKDAEFGYRSSMFKNNKYIVTEVVLELKKGSKEEIKEKMDEFAKYRKEKQPIEMPSAGSTFKRGEDFITAKLIDEAGLKGFCIGGAEVSKKHSGFVVNKGNATAKDVLDLVKYIKEKVEEKFQKKIELEIKIIGK